MGQAKNTTPENFLSALAVATELLCGPDGYIQNPRAILNGLLAGLPIDMVSRTLLSASSALLKDLQARLGLSLTGTIEYATTTALDRGWGITDSLHAIESRLLALTVTAVPDVAEEERQRYLQDASPVDIICRLTELVVATSALIDEQTGTIPGEAIRSIFNLGELVPSTFN